VYTHLPAELNLAPLAPQFWGELDFQSPPELGDLGGENDSNEVKLDLCVHPSPYSLPHFLQL
jgi:hypothetical protein